MSIYVSHPFSLTLFLLFFVIVQFVAFCFIIFDFYSSDVCLFSNERKKGYGFNWEGKWKGPQRFRRVETIIIIYFIKNIFSYFQ